MSVRRLAELAAGTSVPLMHSMMGTLPDKAAWFDAMNTYNAEAKIDRVFENTVFWIVTRSNRCFY